MGQSWTAKGKMSNHSFSPTWLLCGHGYIPECIGGAISSANSGLGEFACGVFRTQIVIRWHLMGAHLVGMHLIDVHLIGMHLVGVHLVGVYLIGVDLIGTHLMSVITRYKRQPCVRQGRTAKARTASVRNRACIS